MTAQGEDILAWLDRAMTHAETAARAAAEAVGGASWDGWEREVAVALPAGDTIADGVMYGDLYEPMKKEACEHIALHDPEAVLRRCAADRKLLALHRPTGCEGFGCDCGSCCATCRWTDADESGNPARWGEVEQCVYPCPTILAVAEGYGWTPTSVPAPAQTPPSDGDQMT